VGLQGTGVVETLVDGLAFPECPRWHDGELWLSEKRAGRVLAVSPGGDVRTVVDVPGGPGGIGWTPSGELLVLDMSARTLLRLDVDGALQTVAELDELTAGRCNDMIVDAAGRAYVGHFGYDLLGGAPPAPATLVLVEPDGSARTVAEDLHFPNGCALTPDGTTLLVAESAAGRITAFDVEADGSLSGRRVFAAVDGVVPDGIALDAAGGLWVSDPVGCAVVRVEAGGAVTARVSTAPAGAFACALGGDDGRTLFVCLYTEQASQLADGAPPIGSVATMRLDIPTA
jgi:sugar lactone lactonase YvrE